jgi:peroxiredoxin
MNKLFALIAVVFLLTSCQTKKKNHSGYTISMSLEGFRDSTQFKLLDLDKEMFIDSTFIENGKLTFNGMVDEPFNARVQTIDGKILILWIENKPINVTGNYKDFMFSKIEGSPLNSVMVKYRDKQKLLDIERDSLMRRLIQLMSSQTEEAKKEFKRIDTQVKQIDKNTYNIRVEGIVSEEPSLYTIKELFFLRNDFSKDSLKLLFDKFPEPLQKTKYGEVVKTYIENKTIEIGDHYIDIEGVNQEGQIVKLSQFKNKYVLLDFWASWCVPCRNENPNLVKVYNKFKDKNFEIVSFSKDSNIEAWKQAIKKDSLTWTNVVDKNGSYSKMFALYGVRGIPASFLINPQGNIIAKNLRGTSLEVKLDEEINKKTRN